MKDTDSKTNTEEKFAVIARELRLIRILLSGLLLLVATAMSSSIDRDLPLIVFPVGLLIAIGWFVVDAVVRRSRRARNEAEEFRRLSGRTERSA